LNKLFYTKEHDWIRFSDIDALIGVTQFKLTGILKIDDIRLFDYGEGNLFEEGTVLHHLHYRDYIIPLHAPINFTILALNPIVSKGLWEWITAQPEGPAGYYG
jgi:glycine cleavage system H protein